MDTSIICILNYNDWKTSARLVDSIVDYRLFKRILVIDNCSKDDSYGQLMDRYGNIDHIDILRSPQNGGYAMGNNFGIRYGIKKYDPDYIFVANPDVLFEEHVASRMVETLKRDESWGVVAPLVRKGYNVWKQPGFVESLKAMLLVSFHIEKKRIKKALQKKHGIQEAGVVEGSFFAIRRKAFEKVKGFDEETFLYCEENILGYRMKQAGYRTAVLADETYEHLHSQSIRKEYRSKRRAFHNFYNSFSYYLDEYVKANRLQMLMFQAAYGIGYLERALYDLIKRK